MSNSVRIKPPLSPVNRALYLLLLLALGYISFVIADHADEETRKKLIAYCSLFAVAIFSTSLPNALVPDRFLAVNQLMNTAPRQLLAIQLRRWLPIVAGLLLPPLIVGFFDPGNWTGQITDKFAHTIASLLTISGMGLYSFMHYYKIGPRSQSWQEGTSGNTWDRIVAYNPTLEPGLPRGLLPALFATSHVFIMGALTTIAALKIDELFGPLFMQAPAILLLAWTFWSNRKAQNVFDRYYYHTNAFYDEMFRRGSIRVSDREPVSYAAVYWVPSTWRAHTWASLVQLDRVFPVGRFMTIMLVVYWIVTLQNPPGTLISTIYLLIVIVAKNLTIYTLTQRRLAPDLIEATFQSKAGWSMTRFFVNLRWTAPLCVALCLVAWLSENFSYTEALGWTALDVALSFVFAWAITYATFNFQRPRLAA